MQLEDSGGEGVVDIFGRLMRLRAKVASSSGVPGGRITDDDLPAHDLLVLIHELEHVTLLAYPLGWLLTSLGLQVSDGRQDSLKLLDQMRSSLIDSSVSPQPEKFLRAVAKWRQYGVRALVVIELVLPLLEGIALYTEGSLQVANLTEGPPSFDLAIALEYQHILSIIGDDSSQSTQFTAADRAELYLDLWDRLITRLSIARSQNATYDATHRLFFGPGKHAPGSETAPYFLGYLFVTRLLQTWQSTTDGELSQHELLSAVNRFVGDVFAFDASFLVGRAKRVNQLEEFLQRLWISLLSAYIYTKDDIDLLLHGKGPLSWHEGKLTTIDIGAADVSAVITRSIVKFVFDDDDDDESAQNSTHEWLTAADPAKNLHLASVRLARIRKYDPLKQTLLLELPEIGQTTTFEVNSTAMSKFLTLRGGKRQPSQSSSEYEWPATPIAAQLQTWLETWPDGIDKDSSDFEKYLNIVKIRRLLVIPDFEHPAAPPAGLFDRNTPDDRSRSLIIRDGLLRSLDANVRAAICDDWRELRLCAERASPFLVEESDKIFGEFWEEYADPTSDIATWCHRAYARFLFPEWPDDDADTIASEKMGILFQELESSGPEGRVAGEVLWQFLKGAVWRPTITAKKRLPPAAATSFDVIRSTSLRVLGVPLVRLGADGWEFDLRPPGEASSLK
jgi:hypothetical protein